MAGNDKYIQWNNGHANCKRFLQARILKIQIDRHGYLRIVLKKKGFFIHQLVAKLFIPNPYNYSEVNHLDGNKCNNLKENLIWCSHLENMRHAKEIGLNKFEIGDHYKSRNPKLNPSQISEIRDRYSKRSIIKCTYNSLSKEFGVHKDTIGLIVRKHKSYKNY